PTPSPPPARPERCTAPRRVGAGSPRLPPPAHTWTGSPDRVHATWIAPPFECRWSGYWIAGFAYPAGRILPGSGRTLRYVTWSGTLGQPWKTPAGMTTTSPADTTRDCPPTD